MRSQRVDNAALIGLGLTILTNCRPCEGLLLTLPVAVALLVRPLGENRRPWRESVPRVVLPLAIVLAIAAAGAGYYNWRVFGSPFTLLYQINRAQYAVASRFPWQPPRPVPQYRHAVMRDFYLNWELSAYQESRSAFGRVAWLNACTLTSFFFGPVLAVPLPHTASSATRPADTSLSWAGLVSIAGIFLGGWFFTPHYAAPVTALIYALLLQSMRYLRV